jgi:hypothetical protein
MQQPYSSWAKALLERQNYPDDRLYPGGPPKRPYDTTAETLPLLFGVEAKAVDVAVKGPLSKERFPFDAPPATTFSAEDTDTWHTVNALWKSGKAVWRNEESGEFAAETRGAGWRQVPRPRIALYKSWMPAMDEGWTRWVFDKFGFGYRDVTNIDFARGDLRSRFDVLIFPDQPERTITEGYAPGSMPAEYTGGIGEQGISAAKQFAQAGGTVLCFNHSASFCIDKLQAQATDVLAHERASDYYSPGSLLNVNLDEKSPLTRGLPRRIAIWSEQSPAFVTDQRSVATYPGDGILASGWLLGAKLLANRSAMVDAKAGEGHIILYGMRPQYRAQSYQAFKLLFNALVAYLR